VCSDKNEGLKLISELAVEEVSLFGDVKIDWPDIRVKGNFSFD